MTDHTTGLVGPDEKTAAAEPVRRILNEPEVQPDSGLALCLSGGGYRAMVFHVGVLWRLNEAGMLPRLTRISSVSGGSITAGVLGLNWSRLEFNASGVAQEFGPQLVDPVRVLAGETVDVGAVLTGLVLPFTSVSDRVVRAYRHHVFGDATLQDLPDEPRFVINATNLESAVLMRFSKPYLADYRVGRVNHSRLPLAVAVAASSAFPPVLSPCTVDLEAESWVTDTGNDLSDQKYRGRIRLTDGGVYDNLGLETAWKQCRTIIISDGGGGPLGADADPPTDWARQMIRVLRIMDGQVRALRKRQAIDAFNSHTRDGMYVGIRSHPTDYPVRDPLAFDPVAAQHLAETPTRLDAMAPELQEHLINWGYTICDAGLRSHLTPGPAPDRLPYPEQPLA